MAGSKRQIWCMSAETECNFRVRPACAGHGMLERECGMRSRIKKIAERLSGNSIWLEPAAPLDEIHALILQLRSIAIRQPLIRVGGDDGGYLVPNDFDGITASISPGVSTEVGFDLALAERGIEVYMADASVAGPPIDNPRFHFTRKFLDVFEDDQNMRLDTLIASMESSHAAGDRILQMDIEGAEFRVLLDASDAALASFRIMAIEFHHLTRMFAKFPFSVIKATFQKLLRTHYIVHIHPNNVCSATVRGNVAIPPVIEFTFYRKDRAILEPNRRLTFPHPLDRNNFTQLPPVPLPAIWQ